MATPLRESFSSVAEKIQEIVDSAERVARDIEVEAKTEADRYREDRRREADALVAERAEHLKGLSASLSEHAERVRAEVAALSDELSRAADELRARPAPESSGDGDGKSGPAPDAAAGEAEERQDAPSGIPEEALLRATQMAVAGNSRDEIEAALKDEFELSNAGEVAEDILGRAG